MILRDEENLFLFQEIFEVNTSSFFRLIEVSGNNLPAALISVLLFELLSSKK